MTGPRTVGDALRVGLTDLAESHRPSPELPDRIIAAAQAIRTSSPRQDRSRAERSHWLAAAAGCAAVLAVGAAAVSGHRSDLHPGAALGQAGANGAPAVFTTTAPPVTRIVDALPVTKYVFSISALPSGLTATYGSTSTDIQSANLASPDGHTGYGSVSVYSTHAPGVPRRGVGALPVEINGQAGFEGVLAGAVATGQSGPVRPAVSVVWQDASGVWVSVDTGAGLAAAGKPPLTTAQLLDVARAVTIVHQPHSTALGVGASVKVMATLRYHPAGMTLIAVSYQPALGLSDLGLSRSSDGVGVSVGLELVHNGVAGQNPTSRQRRVTVGSFTGYYDPDLGQLLLSDGHLNLTIAGRQPPQLPAAQFFKIAQGLSIATHPANVETWYDATNALHD